MEILSLSLFQFKNYREAFLEFNPKINCFTGNNGSGKTNLLEAIYYLSFCKGFGNTLDFQNILSGHDMFVIQGQYKLNGKTDELYCGLKKGQKKIFRKNKKDYDRFADHIGNYPLVLIHPSDVLIIDGGSDERRKFLDGVIAQNNKEYLQHILDYNKALAQRNTLLKYFAERKSFDPSSLEIWDEKLIVHGNYIYDERARFFKLYKDVFHNSYVALTGFAEKTDIEYESQLTNEEFSKLLLNSRSKDLALQHTTTGIHKDNLIFMLDGQPLKKFGSQGQQKSYVIALKLAQYEFTRQNKGFDPILLFDDVFDKLDPIRVEQLVQMVSDKEYGQVFFTDTHSSRIEAIFKNSGAPCRIFDVGGGTIETIRDMGNKV